MDGIHDLGGMQGFGTVPVSEGDAPFTHDWERRMWALARTQRVPGMTIDQFRHTVEQMVPADYLTYGYFEKWCATYLTLYVQTGTFTLDEVFAGNTSVTGTAPEALTLDGMLDLNRNLALTYERPAEAPPAFAIGDRVRTLRQPPHTGHTRLPRYARAATGEVIAHHGAHVFADSNAEGIEEAQHLYTVAFSARSLWGPEAHPKDRVTLELYESYLIRSEASD